MSSEVFTKGLTFALLWPQPPWHQSWILFLMPFQEPMSDRSADSLVFCVDTCDHKGKFLEESDSSEDAVWKIYHSVFNSL